MTQDFIDFGNFSKKILVNPNVVLQVLELYCRNQKKRVQATLLGKVYSNAIEALQIVPVDICQIDQIKKLDYLQHSKSLENILAVYPNLVLLGVIVTDLQPDKNLAILHTTYSNKESGFKAQGILTHPIILSLGTPIKKGADNFNINCFCLSQSFLFCKDLMGITSFERLKATISLGDSDIQTMAPLFEALNDGEQFVPQGGVQNLVQSLISLLQKLKSGNNEKNENAKIKRLLDRLRVEHDYNIEELAYIMEYGSLQRRITSKISTIKD